MKKILIFTTIILSLLPFSLFSQSASTDQALLSKYWKYRLRLKYFVIPGNAGQLRGEGMVAGIRNQQSTGLISYGDQMVHMGYYLGVLATEYALLVSYGQDASATLQELNTALDCYVRNDLCESRMPWYKNFDTYDGFHMRQDVPESFIVEHPQINEGLTSTDIVGSLSPGRPAWVEHVSANDYQNWEVEPGGTPHLVFQSDQDMKNGSMSQDNAIGLLKGLALVHKCIPSGYYAHDKASEIANKVITRMWGAGSWIILDPNKEAVPRGSDAYFYSIPLTVINLTMDNPPLPSPVLAQNANLTWQGLQYVPTEPMNNCMTMTMAALCDCWNGSLVGLPGVNTTKGCIYQLSEQDNWDTFYLLLWEYLHDKSTSLLSMGKVRDQLIAAPCDGPYCYDSVMHIHAENGWASTYKFEQGEDFQNHGKIGSQGNYNGLDYMLLYNLYHLVSLRDNYTPSAFINMISMNLSGELPMCHYNNSITNIGSSQHPSHYQAFETIVSNQLIDTYVHPAEPIWNIGNCPTIGSFDPGRVTYRAGKSILLQAGFHAVAGSYFRAYIEGFDCPDLQKKDTNNNLNDHQLPAIMAESQGEWNVEAALEAILGTYNDSSSMPTNNSLSLSVFPNPFSERVILRFNLPINTDVSLSIYNVNGLVVYSSIFMNVKAGANSIEVNTQELSSGQYCIVLKADNIIASKNIIKEE